MGQVFIFTHGGLVEYCASQNATLCNRFRETVSYPIQPYALCVIKGSIKIHAVSHRKLKAAFDVAECQ